MIRLTALIEVEGQGKRALTFESAAKSFTIGRDKSADFQLPLNTVSRVHAKVSETDKVYVLEDLGSTHGTLLNGKLITKGGKAVLKDGDVVQITQARLTCKIEADKIVSAAPGEGTNVVARKAVEGILGRLGDAEGEKPYLRVISGAHEGKQIVLEKGAEWTLGRGKDCELMLDDPNISRRHAVLRKDWNGYTIQDLGSKNGVEVGGRNATRPRRLKDKDEIALGPVRMVFVDPDADLMEALKDVPGFEDPAAEESAVEAMPAEPSMPAPQGDVPEPELGEDYQAPEPEEEAVGALDAIDEDLLGDSSGLPFDNLIMGVAVAVALGCLALLVYLLS